MNPYSLNLNANVVYLDVALGIINNKFKAQDFLMRAQKNYNNKIYK